ncbi:c-type cytochrome [Ancylobacter lacus]|uniref:c-type cytochrome n=1 Tax=Ancylobacter lacus TaxID=2579970 RepID=UPI001BCEADA7|nr:cytochrome c [Ancylobacter lacus]MBS7539696.1 cytochrome c [Ancylobacter lacus]
MHKTIILAAAAAAFLLAALPAAGASEAELKRGRYLAAIMDCGGCHTPGAFAGKPDMARPLAGSEIGFQIPGLGVFYPPNLTPDAATGLGGWSVADIVKAVRTGERPDGRVLAPAMPWRSYAALTDADARALAAYLKSLPPVANQVPPVTGANARPPAPYLTVVAP